MVSLGLYCSCASLYTHKDGLWAVLCNDSWIAGCLVGRQWFDRFQAPCVLFRALPEASVVPTHLRAGPSAIEQLPVGHC